MANKITKYVLVESTSKLVVQVVMEADGEGELVNYSLLDPTADFNPTMTADTQLTIVQVWSSCAWFDVALRFNALLPTTSWVVSRDATGYHDFRYFGGLKDRSGDEHDGKVLLSTNGFDTPGSIGTMVIEFKKS